MKGTKLVQLRHKIDVSPVFIADFYRHHTLHKKFEIFLCGGEVGSHHTDIRINLREIIKKRFGCVAYLGEDRIKEIQKRPKLDKDLLTIEVGWAIKADLIVMFLGSAGTVSEVTAFAMTKLVNPKLIVFNDIEFKHAKSFISEGPLKLLKKHQIFYYDSKHAELGAEVLGRLDYGISQAIHSSVYNSVHFHNQIVLAMICALYPVTYSELLDRIHMPEKAFLDILRKLFDDGLIAKVEKIKSFVPVKTIEEMPFPKGMISDISRARCRVMAQFMNDEVFVNRYNHIQRQLRGAGRFRTA